MSDSGLRNYAETTGRLASIDRGIFDIAVPAYQQLVERLASRSDGEEILMDAKRQLDSMREQRDTLARSFERVYRQYLTVVAAAGVGYLDQIKAARSSIVRAGGTESDIGRGHDGEILPVNPFEGAGLSAAGRTAGQPLGRRGDSHGC